MSLKVGDTLGPLEKPPITKKQLVMYAGASGDFNPIHYDHEFAAAGGYPSVIAHGMLSMAFFGQLLGAYRVLRISTRFKAVTFPGDVVSVAGEVVSADEKSAEIKLTARVARENGAAIVTLEGSATVEQR
jgi:acyl dehydratase